MIGIKKIYWEIGFFLRFVKLNSRLKKAISESNRIFFFPFYHTGGAEQIHLLITQQFDHKQTILICQKSANNHFEDAFKEQGHFFELHQFLNYSWYRNKILKTYNRFICDNTKLFGCHTLHYYETIQMLKERSPKIKTVDLLHAMVKAEEPGFEKFSLPFLKYIDLRILISEHLKNELSLFYEKKGIKTPPKSLIIYNCVTTQHSSMSSRKFDPFHCLFVGRAAPEKNIELLGQLCKALEKKFESIQFHFVGNGLDLALKNMSVANAIFYGDVKDQTLLTEIYRRSNVLLLTSDREGMPLVIIEAMLNGTIPIVRNVGAINELPLEDFQRISGQNKEEIIENFLNSIDRLKNEQFWIKTSNLNLKNIQTFNSIETFSEKYRTALA